MDERDAVLLLDLLRMRAKRKRNGRATQDTEKIPPPHVSPRLDKASYQFK
jgi:hypothetical protein